MVQIAILSTNMDLTIWANEKNILTGQWTMVENVTASLLEAESGNDAPTEHVLKCQITSVSWSPQPDFGIHPTPCIDRSLLILGTRAGCIVLMRFNGTSSMEVVQRFPVSQSWIAHLAISEWMNIEQGRCSSFLAAGSSDGKIQLIKLTQAIISDNQATTVDIELLPEPHSENIAGITAIRWVKTGNGSLVLVFCTPGRVHLWQNPTGNGQLSGIRTFSLKTRQLCISSTALSNVSGIQYITHMDALCVSLSDGSLYVIHSISIEPSLTAPSDSGEIMSTAARSVFVQCEQGDVQFQDMCRIGGLTAFDWSSFAWIYESCCLSDFSYKHDSKQSITLVIANLHDEVEDEVFMHEFTNVLARAGTGIFKSPLENLRPVLLRLKKYNTVFRHLPQILKALGNPIPDNAGAALELFSGHLNSSSRLQFRRSLAQHLFGYDDILSQRLRLIIADFAWNCCAADDDQQSECGVVAKSLLLSISHHILRVVIRHLAAFASLLTVNDMPFVLRIAMQTLLPDYPPDLLAESQALMVQLSTAGLYDLASPLSPQSLDERCPACGAEVPFTDITQAQCSNGHKWRRCSITSFILATTAVRTCIGCTRKALLPFAAVELSQAGNCGWALQELLEAVPKCLFCGNSFVVIV